MAKNGFEEIKNLNETENNFKFADFSATKQGVRYLISVKARNKYENTGKLNYRYKLGSKVHENISDLVSCTEYSDYVTAWLAIALEENFYDAYFGTIKQLKGSQVIKFSTLSS